MDESSIAAYVREHIEPLPHPHYGPRYRVAATLKDGLFLPCVVIASRTRRLELADKRLKETKLDERILSTFVCSGNRLNHYDIATLSVSPYAIPLSHLKNMGGETSMMWTQFHVIMNDNKEFIFGTTFLDEFFSMPDGYSADNVIRIFPAQKGERITAEGIYRERPFFECLIAGL
ncbi:MAG: hypothetical protein LV481_11705 [Methylacidiphilales bacterium]|nr:hypothetical protein [Candidatus Methylacidiphilales bacterium]